MADRSELLKRQKILSDFGDFVLDHDDLDQILNEGCRLVSQALGADLAKVLEIDRTNDTALVRAGIGWNDGIVGQERISLSERSSEAFAIEQGEPVITNDIAQETRFRFPDFLTAHGVIALVNVPIFLPGRQAWGVLQVDACEPRQFEQEDIEFLNTYAMVLGPVVDRLQHIRKHTESEAKYRMLFDSIDEGFCVIEVVFDGTTPVDYVFLESNPAFERQTGISNAAGRRMREIAPEHEQHWFDIYGRIALTGKPERFQQQAEALGRYYDVYAFRIGDPDQRHVAILFNDIAERKRAEAALRESEDRKAFLLKLSDALRTIEDASEIQATTARMVAEHLGADRAMYAEVEGEPGSERGTLRGQYVRGAATKEVVPFPEHFTFGQFGQHTMSARYRGEPLIVADVQNDPAYSAEERAAWARFGVRAAIVATLPKGERLVAEFGVHSASAREWTEAEITLVKEVAERSWAGAQRARAEAALRESEEKYRVLFDTIDSGYALTDNMRDDEGRVVDLFGVDFNRSYTQHSGLPPFAGRRASEVINVEPEWLRQFEEVSRTGVPARFENYIAERDRWVSTHYSLVGDLGSDRVAVVFDDITDRKRAEQALRESEERQAFQLQLSDALRPLSDPVEAMAVATELLGRHLGAGRCGYGEVDDTDEFFIVERDWNDGVMPSFRGKHLLVSFGPEFTAAYRAGRSVRIDDALADARAAGAEAAFEAAGSVRASLGIPLIKDGRFAAGLFVQQMEPRHWTDKEEALARDVVERTWASVERVRAETALRESKESYAALFASSPAPFLILRPDAPHFTIADVNDAYLAATMQTRENLVGRAMFDAFPDNPNDPAADRESSLGAALERALVSGRFEVMDVQKYDVIRPDGTFEERWWKPANAPALDVSGNVVAIIHHVADVTSEHRAVEGLRASERHAQILLAELQHRVRNILAMMRSVVRRTSRSKTDVQDFVQHLQGRIDAMARTQMLLTRVPGRSVNLEDVVREELIAQAAEDSKAVVRGPEVGLSPHAAELVTLAIHELATNSVKYGALGQRDGRVNVSWKCLAHHGQQRLLLTWHETGLKNGEPSTAGFGTELITQRVPYELNGRGEIKMANGTLTATIEFPLEHGSSILETQPSH